MQSLSLLSVRMLVLVLSAILSCIMYAWWSLRPRRHSPPVLPGALPFIGHLHQAIGDRKHLWNAIRNVQMCSLVQEGGVIELWLGPHSVYVITDPEVSLTLSNTCLNRPYMFDFGKDFVPNGLFAVKASLWKSKRKLLNPSFNQQVLNTYVNEMNVQARSLVSRLESKVGKGPFDVQKCFVDYTVSTVTGTLLGLNTKTTQDEKSINTDYAEALEDLIGLYCDRLQRLWLHLSFIFNWSSMKRKQDQLTSKLKSIMNLVINKRSNELNANKNQQICDGLTPDKFIPILDQLLSVADKQEDFPHDEIREHLDTLVFAAYDTTSAALTFILHLIGSHRDVQERVFNELQKVLEHKDGDLNQSDLPKLVYMEAVIKESMRLYPPGPFSARKIDKDIELKNCTLRAGSTWVMSFYGLLRHPMWGPDADQFRPERWLDPASLPDHPGFYAAFGIGKRNCIGKLYGMLMMKVALAHVLRRYHVSGDIDKVVCEYKIVLKPVEGHHVDLKLRR